MSVEGLWCFQTSSVADPTTYQDGGVVVLETGRVLGGDSAFAYVGDYEVSGSEIAARVRVYQWNKAYGDIETVFGMKGPDIDYVVHLRGKRDGDFIHGVIIPEQAPDAQLPIRMLFIQNLPG